MFAASKTKQVSSAANFVEDVFSTYLYTGTGAVQTINNGIDLAGKGGLVWTKGRTTARNNVFVDTVRGGDSALYGNTTDAAFAWTTYGLSAYTFGATGYTTSNSSVDTENGYNFASWTFRKQPKFFDCGTGTTSGSANKRIAHTLGATPGCIIVKNISSTGGDWYVWHRSLASSTNSYLKLNTTGAVGTSSGIWGSSGPTSTDFGVNENVWQGANGEAYVWYAFAHDAGGFGLTGTDNVISCGTFAGASSTPGPLINLGWEPQWILFKKVNSSQAWFVQDNMRGMPNGSSAKGLMPNASDAEFDMSQLTPTATGFFIGNALGATSDTYIYIAIRRGPMKVPTDGTKVYSAATHTPNDTGAFYKTSGFPVDLTVLLSRQNSADKNLWVDRLRGSDNASRALGSSNTGAEATQSTNSSFSMDLMTQVKFNANNNDSIASGGYSSLIAWFFKRAPNFFDEVCYTGTGSALTVNHNLAVVPELIIYKNRTNGSTDWAVGYNFTASTWDLIFLNYSDAGYGGNAYSSGSTGFYAAQPTSTTLSFGTSTNANSPNLSAKNYVAYLFATCAGVSKVGSYTGNGSNQTINCGFAAGARFIMIKRTDSTGDWYVWDTARGIISANDPHLSLNTTAAEVTTDDSIDPDSSGFIVNQLAATNINVNAATYIYLAIA